MRYIKEIQVKWIAIAGRYIKLTYAKKTIEDINRFHLNFRIKQQLANDTTLSQ
jgi:hypothetical protein